MATHSSVLAWRIPGTGDASIWGFPGGSAVENLPANAESQKFKKKKYISNFLAPRH